MHSAAATSEIAIVGIGCRLPGNANSPEQFWRLLAEGRDAITELPKERFDLTELFDSDPAAPGKMYIRRGGFVEHIDQFDAAFFGISPREAAFLDPQHRLLLEVAYEALEDAGLPLDRLDKSPTGVFVGISTHDYGEIQRYPGNRGQIGSYSNSGTATSIAANRLSYVFGLRGPSFAVDTACSSALTAAHLACQSLCRGECDLALLAGAQVLLTPEPTIGFCKASMLSPDGRCSAFDAAANGYVRSEGVGVVVLKPLAAALADGDAVYAVIRGTAINQDGRTTGMTVPSRDAQEAMLRAALQQAGIEPSNVDYVEAHGTGTPVGDPIEANAIGEVVGRNRIHRPACVIGSVKTNIGHLEAASGIAGLIKAALALSHRQIPPSLHCSNPNPAIDFEGLKLRVATSLEAWPQSSRPGIAGVNSFGFGGANAHVVLQEAPYSSPQEASSPGSSDGTELLPISARSEAALLATAYAYREYLGSRPDVLLADLCGSAALRRTHHPHRAAIAASSREEMIEGLDAIVNGEQRAGVAMGRAAVADSSKLAFVFTGMGPQWWGMGRQLLRDEPVFRRAIERCDGALHPLTGWSLLELLQQDEAGSRMGEADRAQVANFAIQTALTALWNSWGIVPDAVIGHSAGSIAAAHVAGVYDLADAALLAHHRARLQNLTSGQGGMLAVGLCADDAREVIGGHASVVSLAAVNSPLSCTLSGDVEALEAIRRVLEQRKVFARMLPVAIPYHSVKMEPLREQLLESLRPLRPHAASIRLMCDVTGAWSEGSEYDAAYWWRNVRNPVRFADGIAALIGDGVRTFVEIGPHPVLATSLHECLAAKGEKGVVLPSLRRLEDDRRTMLRSLGALAVQGRPVEWKAVQSRFQKFVRLPTYPWQHERHWFESRAAAGGYARATFGTSTEHPLLGSRLPAPNPQWNASIEPGVRRWLDDHVVQGAVVFPAAAYIEMALSAAAARTPDAAVAANDIELSKALFFRNGAQPVLQTALDAGNRLTIHSNSASAEDGWTLHASCRIDSVAQPAPIVSIREIQARASRELTPAACYDALKKRGLEYGACFQGIDRIWQGEKEGLGHIDIARLGLDPAPYKIHPVLLDAALQVFIAADSADRRQAGRGPLMLPVHFESVTLYRSPGASAWSHAKLVRQDAKMLAGDIDIVDDEGTTLVAIRGLRCQAIERDTARTNSLADYLYEFRWEPSPVAASPSVASDSSKAAHSASMQAGWLLLSDCGGAGTRLADALTRRGAAVTLVRQGDAFRQCAPHVYEGRPDHAWDLGEVMKGIGDRINEFRGVVLLGALDAPGVANISGEALIDGQGLVCDRSLAVLATLQSAKLPSPPVLYLVTAGAQSAGSGNKETVAIAQAPLWGLARAAMREQYDVKCLLADLDHSLSDEAVAALASEILADSVEEEIAFRGSGRWVHRLARTAPDTAKALGVRCQPSPEEGWHVEVATPGVLSTITAVASARREPGPDEVEVAVEAAALNFRDVMLAAGMMPPEAAEDSLGGNGLGLDYAGRVVRCGKEVRNFAPGDEVIGIAHNALASFVTTPASLVCRKPALLSFATASAIPCAFATAHYALEKLARVAPGERVLIHAATGGVGLAAIQVARRAGAEIFATAGSPEKRAYLESLGIRHVLDSRSLAFADAVLEITGGKGVDVILNSLAGEAISKGLAILSPYGRFVEIGKRDIYGDSRLGLLPFRKNISFFAVDLDRMCRERPELAGTILREVLDRFESGDYRPIPQRVFPMSEIEGAVRLMAQAKHIGKIVVETADPELHISVLRAVVRNDGTYLVTGGPRGFGMATVQWLARQGARSLVVMARSEPSSEAIADLHALATQGIRIEIARGDVTRAEDIRRVVRDIRATMAPLRGVLHCATVYDDAPLSEMTPERMRNVLAPKMVGAWNLHNETREDQLDFFVCYSSMASILGNPMQVNYCAANEFLDAFAQYRRAHGLPALTVHWGILADAGHVARTPELAEFLERQGYGSVTTSEALAALEQLLKQDSPNVAVARIDWRRLAGYFPSMVGSTSFRSFWPSEDAQAPRSREGNSIRVTLAEAGDESARLAVLEQYLREKGGKVLGISPQRIDPDKALTDMGLDSIIAVELVTVLNLELGYELPVVKILQGLSIRQLGAMIAASLPRTAAPVTTPRVTTSAPPMAEMPPAAPLTSADARSPLIHAVAVHTNGATSGANGAASRKNGSAPHQHAELPYQAWSRSQRIARLCARGVLAAATDLQVSGAERFPTSGPFILASNHLSWLDIPLMLAVVPRPVVVMAAEWLEKSAVTKWLSTDFGNAIFVRRGEGDLQALEDGLDVLHSGGVLMMSPEGTRSKNGGLTRGQTGAAYLAAKAGVPVIPMALWGQENLVESWRGLRRAGLNIRFGEPVHVPAGVVSAADLRQQTDCIMQSLAALLPPAYRGVYE